MRAVEITRVVVLDNPAPILTPLRFEITYECLFSLREDLEWKLIYVGSADSECYDQLLENVFVGPLKSGRFRFVLQADAPDPSKIPEEDILGVTVLLLSCAYLGREFIKIGYCVINDFVDEGLRSEPHRKTLIDRVQRNILAGRPCVTKLPIIFHPDPNENEKPSDITLYGHHCFPFLSITRVNILDNPAPFLTPLRFKIEFECLFPLREDLQWDLIYVGSADSEDDDQLLANVFVGPISVGQYSFVLEGDAPTLSKIPDKDILGWTILLLTCSYLGQEFIRIGYYVINDYDDEQLRAEPPPEVLIESVQRNVLSDKPRVTEFPIIFHPELNQTRLRIHQTLRSLEKPSTRYDLLVNLLLRIALVSCRQSIH